MTFSIDVNCVPLERVMHVFLLREAFPEKTTLSFGHSHAIWATFQFKYPGYNCEFGEIRSLSNVYYMVKMVKKI